MLQMRAAALRGLQRRTPSSARLTHPQSSLQTWRLLAVVKPPGRPKAQTFATSPEPPADTTEETVSSPVPDDVSKADKSVPRKKKISRKNARQLKVEKTKKSPTNTRPAESTKQTPSNNDDDEVLRKVLGSLKQLEKNFATLSAGVDKLNTSTRTPVRPTSDSDGAAPKPAPGANKAAKSKTKAMETIAATVDVLKNVLNSQNIPIDGLGKKSNKVKPDARGKPDPIDTPTPDAPLPEKTTEKTAEKAAEKTPESASKPSPAGEETPTSTHKAQKPIPAAPKAKPSSSWSTLVKGAAVGSLGARLAKKAAAAAQPASSSPHPGNSETFVKVETLSADSAKLTPVEQPSMPPVAKLAYGLDRVLFNPGVYHLQDPRSKVFNFDPYLSKIMPLNEFDFSALQRYVTSSKDTTLNKLAAKLGKKYSGSTSSMTSMLGHFHFLLSNWRPVSAQHLSRSFPLEWDTFNNISRAPAATFLHLRDGVYSIDADKEHDSANILSMLGKSMEKLLTLSKEDFERYRHANSAQISEEERNAAEAYHFSTLGDFLMRSQLDATDPRLPGTGMFDLKTRAVVSIRMDAEGFQKGLGYEIRGRFGEWESFEREYYDMIRSAFLKYSLQVRMGRMDGIYVAFHNTQRIFGFQYIPLSEMDQALHGTSSTLLGDEEFKLSLLLLNKLLDRATERFPGRNIRLHVETRPGKSPFMYVFAKPVTPAEIEKVQTANHAAIAQFEDRFLGLQRDEAAAERETAASDAGAPQSMTEQGAQAVLSQEDTKREESRQDPFEYWEQMREQVEEAVEDDARGISHVRDAIQDALEQSGLLNAKSPVEARAYVTSLLDALVRTDEQNLAGSTREQLNDQAEPAAEAAQSTSPAQEAESSPTTPAADNNRTPEGSLKDLIVQVAERLDERSEDIGHRAASEAASDKSQLREFERILSDLITNRSTQDTAADQAEEPMSIDFNEPRPEASVASGSDAAMGVDAEGDSKTDATLSVEGDEILGMHLMIRNKINGKYVDRPNPLTYNHKTKWSVEYSIEEIKTKRAKQLYGSIQQRRKKALENGDEEVRNAAWQGMFEGNLVHYSRRGRSYRAQQDSIARTKPVYTAESEEPISYDEAFAHHRQWKELDLNK